MELEYASQTKIWLFPVLRFESVSMNLQKLFVYLHHKYTGCCICSLQDTILDNFDADIYCLESEMKFT